MLDCKIDEYYKQSTEILRRFNFYENSMINNAAKLELNYESVMDKLKNAKLLL